jgi:4-diphosphocytidyl-2-C-methyl-D-erythritol kinase
MLLVARAKINWSLDVTGARDDGYHNLDSIMQSVEMCDLINVEPANDIEIICPGVTGENIARKAALAFFEATGISGGCLIEIEKHIPIGAGLGGESADAAAVLKALDAIYGTDLKEDLLKIALSVGSDVPFCIEGGLVRATGRGEIMRQLPYNNTYHIVILKPKDQLMTPDVFKLYGKIGGEHPNIDGAADALAKGDLNLLSDTMGNALKKAAVALCPRIDAAIDLLKRNGVKAVGMTGSGPAVFGVMETPVKMDVEDFDVVYTSTSPRGAEIL